MKNSEKTLEMIVNLCKNRGFVYAGSEIYGGLANSWDYGPLGVEFKNNVKKAWMKKFVQESPYNVGLDAAILMNRENDREALKTILHAIDMLKEDQASIGVFPEGYIRPDRKLHRFRSGVFKIAQRTKVPVVVCTLQNSQYIRFNYKKLKTTHIQLHLLDVITPEQYEGMSTVELGNMIYEMMAKDLGPENISAEAD